MSHTIIYKIILIATLICMLSGCFKKPVEQQQDTQSGSQLQTGALTPVSETTSSGETIDVSSPDAQEEETIQDAAERSETSSESSRESTSASGTVIPSKEYLDSQVEDLNTLFKDI